ncbi:CCR4-NOT complex subunit CAF16 [Strigomonas culicis]|uniref:CCR4-NOT complex subunit CAF16 n=1 Tax=Strigomonas culicis TaxID=28005 RepID=S9V3L7_9TRYP|nr:CCR4-NOT complex subunit CAF16 [Strigomonas culicis]|eukprot:EPY17455.1 CCR4-NOT complex subunit CAF16 [Strigomonas culicis]
MADHVTLIGTPWPPEAFFANTVDRICEPAPDAAKKQRVAAALHLRLSRAVDQMSAGEKRRVQILHGFLHDASVFLLDECSTDIDVAERQTVLEMVKAQTETCRAAGAVPEAEGLPGCCLYATHILDKIGGWATHVLLMREGEVVAYKPVSEIDEPLEVFAHRFMVEQKVGTATVAGGGDVRADPADEAEVDAVGVFNEANVLKYHFDDLQRYHAQQQQQGWPARSYHYKWIDGQRNYWNGPELAAALVPANRREAAAAPPPAMAFESVIRAQKHFVYKSIFNGLEFAIPQGERVLLCGCNGCGKSTLLNMLGGKLFFNNRGGHLLLYDRYPCFDDMTVTHQSVSFGGDWWAAAPPGEMYVRQIVALRTPRAHYLRELLQVDLDWDVREISSGEQKRVQLLLYLLEDRPIVLLDEATADLDVHQRHGLLFFLMEESLFRGVTVVYATHIFGGLRGWASTMLVFDRTTAGVHAHWRKPPPGEARGDEPYLTADGELSLDYVTEELTRLKEREAF